MLEFEKVLPDIYLLRTPFGAIWSGVYLLTGSPCIMIDTGASGEVAEKYIVPALEKMKMTPADIDWIINTHSHGDHVGGNKRLLELSNHAKMAAFEGAVDKIENPLPYGRAIRTRFPEHSLTPQEVLEGCKVDLPLKDGEVLGKRLKVIHTPGHDSECVCLVDIPTGAVFTGDSLQGFGMVGDGGAGLAFYQYLQDYRQTLERIRKLCPQYILTAHNYAPYGYCAFGEKEVNRYLQACQATVDIYDILVRRQMKTGLNDVAEITRGVIRQVGAEMPEYLFLAMYSIQAHMTEVQEDV